MCIVGEKGYINNCRLRREIRQTAVSALRNEFVDGMFRIERNTNTNWDFSTRGV